MLSLRLWILVSIVLVGFGRVGRAQDVLPRAAGELTGESPADHLAAAIDSGSVAAVRRVLDSGVSPNTSVYGSTPLTWAILEEKYYVTKLLIDRGADVNLADDGGYTPLLSACDASSEKLAKLLVDSGAKVNVVEPTYGISPLQAACSIGNEAMVDFLIEHKADVTHTDKYDGNCLEEAAFYGHKSIVEKLSKRGIKTKWPLHVAAGLGDKTKVEELLSEADDVHQAANQANDGWNNTPLLFALGGGHLEIAQLLVKNGAKLDAKNVLGAGPLHIAASVNQPDQIEWLISQGADVNATDNEDSPPLDWAASDEVAKVLEAAGAKYGEYEE